jgi:chromosome segregation ATPase
MEPTPQNAAKQAPKLLRSSESCPLVEPREGEATFRARIEQKIVSSHVSLVMQGLVNRYKVQTNNEGVTGSEVLDHLDRDLWAAGQAIQACRQDRMNTSLKYHKLKDTSQGLQKNNSVLTANYYELCNNYNLLTTRFNDLRAKYNAILIDSDKRQQTANDQADEIEKLNARIEVQDRTIRRYKEEKATLTAESLASQTLIQQMEEWQNKLEQDHTQDMEDKRQLKQHASNLEMDMSTLQQKFAQIKEALTSWFPDLDEDMDNINTIFGKVEKATRKRRKQVR